MNETEVPKSMTETPTEETSSFGSFMSIGIIVLLIIGAGVYFLVLK